MSKLPLSLRTTLVVVCAGSIALTSVGAAAQPAELPLFTEQPFPYGVVLPEQAIAGRSWAVNVNYGLLRSARLTLNLPGDITYEAVREEAQNLGESRFTWVGHASDNPDSRVVIAVSRNAVAGAFAHQGRLFKLEPRADGSQVLSEVENTDPAPELDPIPVVDATAASGNTASSGSVAADSNSAVQDVLVAYTPAVQALYGSDGADALIIQAVAETNQAYSNSNMMTRLNLVHSIATDYLESGDMHTDLSRLKGTSDGFMDELHTARDLYGADLVSLIEVNPQYCGLGYLMSSLSNSFATSAFSTVHHACATGYFSFGHEIGHNQGAHHDLANASDPTIYPYAHGYQEPNNVFRTIMAYNCPGGCTRVGHFSNPNVLYSGLPTGEPTYGANAIAIDQTASTVAAFREHVTQLPPGC